MTTAIKTSVLALLIFCVGTVGWLTVFNDMAGYYNPSVADEYNEFTLMTGQHVNYTRTNVTVKSEQAIRNTTTTEDDLEGGLIAGSWRAIQYVWSIPTMVIKMMQYIKAELAIPNFIVYALTTAITFIITFAIISWVFRRND